MGRESENAALEGLWRELCPDGRVRCPGFLLEADGERLTHRDFPLLARREGAGVVLTGRRGGLTVRWELLREPRGLLAALTLGSDRPVRCSLLAPLVLEYVPDGDMGDVKLLCRGDSNESVGLLPVSALSERSRRDSLLRGAFSDSVSPGLFMGTLLPQRFRHEYEVEREGDALRFSAVTRFPEGLAAGREFRSETVFFTASLPVLASIEAYAARLPAHEPACARGWNSWDYYFCALGPGDIEENLRALRDRPSLGAKLRYIVVDMGWEHREGEWHENHRFSCGLPAVAQLIRDHGYVPGIWTAPLRVAPLSCPALRDYDMLLRDRYGDPVSDSEGFYLIDPTHPKGADFIRALYTRLRRAGFRFFKVDFVGELARCGFFHDASKGPYQVLAGLFREIRDCVGPESYLLGCSLPAECGPGLCDGGRVGVDIHNHWEHVKWAADYLSLSWWMHGRLWANDPDFLIVRGRDTSTEAVTNVLNPRAHSPDPPRWRRGPVFDGAESQTWADLAAAAGGNLFLSDRIAALNGRGLSMLAESLSRGGNNRAARPLDLCDGPRPALWYREPGELTVINWEDGERMLTVDLARYGLPAPRLIGGGRRGAMLRGGRILITLPAHGSDVLELRF